MFQEGGVGPEWGPLMMMKNSLFLLISNVLGRGPTNDVEEFSVSVVFKGFRKGIWGWEGAH